MMGNPSNVNETATQKTPLKNRVIAPNSPAIPMDMDDIPVSPIAASTDFGSTPTKSYAAFPRTPQGTGAAVLEAPSSRLRHSITMKKVAAGLDDPNAEANLSFDMGDVEMLTSADNLNQLAATPFAKTGQANYVTLKEQEKVILSFHYRILIIIFLLQIMDEIKKENFDLKLRVSLLQERLSRSTPENIEGALSEVI